MAITGGILTATLPAAVPPPAAAPANLAGLLQLELLPNAQGSGMQAGTPVGPVPVWYPDLTGPQLPAGAKVRVEVSNGGKYYVCGAAGYYGLSPAAVAAQSGFSGF